MDIEGVGHVCRLFNFLYGKNMEKLIVFLFGLFLLNAAF